jgi:hypothetical protein
MESQASFAQNATQDRRRKRPEEATIDTRSRSISPSSESDASVWKMSPNRSSDSIDEKPGRCSHLVESSTLSTDQSGLLVYGGSFAPSLSKGLADDWDLHLISLFTSKVCSRVNPQTSIGFLSFLPSMIINEAASNEDSGLILTCRAISYAFIANQSGTPESKSRRSLAYGQALKTTNAALNDDVLRVKDETLVSVWLLSLYEVLGPCYNTWEIS